MDIACGEVQSFGVPISTLSTSAKVPHKDRAGLLYLARGALTARDGTLAFMQGVQQLIS